MTYHIITRHYQRPLKPEQVKAYILSADRRKHRIEGGLAVVRSDGQVLFRVMPKINRRPYINV